MDSSIVTQFWTYRLRFRKRFTQTVRGSGGSRHSDVTNRGEGARLRENPLPPSEMNNELNESAPHAASEDGNSAASVPVYNCHAFLSPPDAEGWISARSCNLPEVVARGKSQREALAALVAAFKTAVSRYRAAGQSIPWAESSAKPVPGEQERWIAVHL